MGLHLWGAVVQTVRSDTVTPRHLTGFWRLGGAGSAGPPPPNQHNLARFHGAIPLSLNST